jgi:hypothetical protein
MLGSILGVRVLLWAGAVVPTPRPELAVALRSVSVTNDEQGPDGFQLGFDVGRDTIGTWDVLRTGGLALMNRVWIAAVIGVTPHVLIDGIVTRHDLQPSADPGRSTLTVSGTDLTTELDLVERNEPHANQPDSVIVTKLIGSYPQLGLVPAVTPTTDVPLEIDRVPRQAGTDLQFIRDAAERNGFAFYLEPVTLGVTKAYWGPALRTGLPQPALTLGMGSAGNVRSLGFSNDGLAPVAVEGSFVEPFSKAIVSLPPLPALRIPPLAALPAFAARTRLLRDTASKGPIGTALASVAQATAAPEAVQGQGELDAVRYGGVLRARGLVGVRGAGLDYDGFYYVRSVSHSIEVGTYTQRFTLSRDGTFPLTPVVVP